MTGTAAGAQRRSLAPLWAMIAIFAAPVVAAWFFYLNPEYLPAGRSNLGELIEPPVALPTDLGLRAPGGADFDHGPLAGKWTLVFLDGGDCGERCVARLTDLRQIRLAVGESQLVVERLLILPSSAAPERLTELGSRFDGMRIALADPDAVERLSGLLGGGPGAVGRVYVLDPMGHLMMRYAPEAPAKDTLNDMERLLKASKNWIKGAQYGHK